MLRPFCGSAFIALVSNDAGENKNRTSDKMNEQIKQLLGASYSWDSECNELNYRGNPVAFWITDYEASMVKLAMQRCN